MITIVATRLMSCDYMTGSKRLQSGEERKHPGCCTHIGTEKGKISKSMVFVCNGQFGPGDFVRRMTLLRYHESSLFVIA